MTGKGKQQLKAKFNAAKQNYLAALKKELKDLLKQIEHLHILRDQKAAEINELDSIEIDLPTSPKNNTQKKRGPKPGSKWSPERRAQFAAKRRT
jgi:hypothetical protein